MMFKYTVDYKLTKGAKASIDILDAADLDLEDWEHMSYFAAEHCVVATIEKIFGKDSCVMWRVVAKTRVMSAVPA